MGEMGVLRSNVKLASLDITGFEMNGEKNNSSINEQPN